MTAMYISVSAGISANANGDDKSNAVLDRLDINSLVDKVII